MVGGAAASLTPEKYEGLADTVIAGEAEYIWPEFCRDFEAGCAKPLYRETGTVESGGLADAALRPLQARPTPTPRCNIRAAAPTPANSATSS